MFWHKDNEQMGIVLSHLVIKLSKLVEIYYMLEAVLGKKIKLKYVWPVPRILYGLIGDGSGRLDM